MPEFAYLESLDSVRGAGPAETGRIQVLLEVVSALAMGRRIVVPQPYAFDSQIFHSVAQQVWRIGDPLDDFVDPFVLHLHGAQSLDAAIAGMLRRTRDPVNPFVSSLFPELHTEWDLTREPSTDELLSRLGSDIRASRLEKVLLHFARTRPATTTTAAAGPPPTLDDLARFLSSYDAPDGLDDVAQRMRRAMSALGLQDKQLGVRSALRSDGAWLADDGPSPLELVGDSGDLELVIEAVDTLYNRVVASSAGAGHQLFTTSVLTQGDRLVAQGFAQRAALAALSDETGVAPAPTISGLVDDQTFAVRSTGSVDLTIPENARLLTQLSRREELEAGIRKLLEARAEPGSDFSRSLTVLTDLRPGPTYDIRFAEHMDLVAGVLGDHYAVAPGPKGQALVAFGSGILPAISSATGSLAGIAVAGPAGGALGAFVAGMSAAIPALNDWRRARRHDTTVHTTLASALTQVLGREAP